MTVKSFVVTVPSAAGGAVRVTEDLAIRAISIHVRPVLGNTGRTYFGGPALNKATLGDVFAEFDNTVSASPSIVPFDMSYDHGGNPYRLADFYCHATEDNNKLLVTYTQV